MTGACDSAHFWDNYYANLDPQWGTAPNAVLTDIVTALAPTPGTALDLGCGHGGTSSGVTHPTGLPPARRAKPRP